jgi:uncharacterized protein (TIGR03382 family)
MGSAPEEGSVMGLSAFAIVAGVGLARRRRSKA